ncbi:MAG: hypothetical protein K2X81_11180 [Candidatus Obscuribacterales bacterium]|nr:hypothetical protein [Candidatus Obscuribacterales bacterium]
MIPELNNDGNLPPGVYDATISEIEQRFGYNSRRRKLLQKLKLLIKNLANAGCKILYLDGSFTTSKEIPEDYDCCWEADQVNNTIDPIIRGIKTFKKDRKEKYGGDIFPRIPELGVDHFLFFQQDGRTGKSKGIIRILLRASKK